jgi:hypothetical protein
MGLGGLYPDPEVVEAILAPQEGPRRLIADIGQSLPISIVPVLTPSGCYKAAEPVYGMESI